MQTQLTPQIGITVKTKNTRQQRSTYTAFVSPSPISKSTFQDEEEISRQKRNTERGEKMTKFVINPLQLSPYVRMNFNLNKIKVCFREVAQAECRRSTKQRDEKPSKIFIKRKNQIDLDQIQQNPEYENGQSNLQGILAKIKLIIKSNPIYDQYLSCAYIQEIVNYPQQYPPSEQQLSDIISLLIDYLTLFQKQEASQKLATTFKIDTFAKEMSSRWRRLKREIFVSNRDTLRMLDYLIPKGKDQLRFYDHCFTQLKFDLSYEQFSKIIETARQLSRSEVSNIYLLFSYLLISCYKIYQEGFSLNHIQQLLTTSISYIDSYVLEKEVKMDISAPEFDMHPNFKVNDTTITQFQINFQKIDKKEKKNKLEESFLEIDKQIIEFKELFDNFAKDICLKEGDHYETNLGQVRAATTHYFLTNFSSKLQQQQLNTAYKSDNLWSLIQEQIAQKKNIYEKCVEQFEDIMKIGVDGLIVIKCYFRNVHKINIVCTLLKEEIVKKEYRLLEVQNHLKDDYSRVEMKIRMGDSIAKLLLINQYRSFQKGIEVTISNFNYFSKYFTLPTSLERSIKIRYAKRIQQIFSTIDKNLQITNKMTQNYNINGVTYDKAKKSFTEYLRVMPKAYSSQLASSFVDRKLKQNYIEHLLKKLKLLEKNSNKTVEKFNTKEAKDEAAYTQRLTLLKNNVTFKEGMYQYDQAYKQQLMYCQFFLNKNQTIINKIISQQCQIEKQNLDILINYSNSIHYLATLSYKSLRNDLSLKYFQQYLSLSVKLEFYSNNLRVKACIIIGTIYSKMQKHAEAVNYFQKGLGYYVQGGYDSPEDHAQLLKQIGLIDKKQKRYPDALKKLYQSLLIHQSLFVPGSNENTQRNVKMSELMRLLGQTYLQTHQYSQALKYFEYALNKIEIEFGQKSIESIQILVFIEQTYRKLGNYKKNRQFLLKLFTIIKATKGEDSLQSFACLNLIAATYIQEPDYEQALISFAQARQIIIKLQGANSNNALKTLNSMGLMHFKLGNIEIAEQMLKQSISIRSQAQITKEYGESLCNVGLVYLEQRKYHEALQHYRTGLLLAERFHFDQHEKGTSLMNFGSVYANLGEYDKAIHYYTKSMEAFEILQGKHSIGYAQNLHNIGCMYLDLRLYGEALKSFESSLSIRHQMQAQPNWEYAFTLQKIGVSYEYLGQYKQAINHLLSSLKIYDSLQSQDRLECITPLHHLAVIATHLEEFDMAILFFNKGIKLAEKTPRYGYGIVLMGQLLPIYKHLNMIEAASELAHKITEINDKLEIKEQTAAFNALSFYAHLYEKQRNYTKAIEKYTLCLEILSKDQIHNTYKIAKLMHEIGFLYWKIADYHSAIYCFKQVIHIFGIMFDTGDLLPAIAVLNCQIGNDQEALSYFLNAFKNKKRLGKIWDSNYLFVIHEIIRLNHRLRKNSDVFHYFLIISYNPEHKPSHYNFDKISVQQQTSSSKQLPFDNSN